MAVKAGSAYITVDPDLTKFNRKFAGLEHDRRWTKIGRGIGSGIAGGASGALKGGAVITGAVLLEAKRSVQAFQDSNKVAEQSQAVLRSTNREAGVTAKTISNLATQISRKTGVDDEAIQSNENLLLTFTNVRNEVGKGNDVFTRATQLATDMSVALGQDGKASAIQLGKALNDPIKGVTALQRVGVSFTASQRDQIKTLVEGGHRLDAQKLILRELNKEFAGSAKAQATSTAKLSVAFGNIEEDIGSGLAPAVDDIAGKLTKFAIDVEPKVIHAADNIAKVFGRKDLSLDQKFRLSYDQAEKIFEPLIKEGGAAIDKLELGDKLSHAVEAAAPKIADALAASAPRTASAFVHAFANANVWGQLVIGGLLLKKMGGLGAFSALGRKAGGAMGTGIASGAAGRSAVAGAAGGGIAGKVASRVPGSLAVAGGTAGAIASLKIGSDFIRGYAKADAAVKVFGDRVHSLVQSGDQAGLSRLSGEIRQYADANQGSFSDSGKAARAYADQVEHALDRVDKAQDKHRGDLAATKRDVRNNWKLMDVGAKTSLGAIAKNVRSNGSLIKLRLGNDSEDGRKALAANFRQAAKAVRTQMDAAGGDTEKGAAKIRTYLVKALVALGLTGEQAQNKLSTGTTGQPGNLTKGIPHMPAQRGGPIHGGKPSGDSIPAVLERGEYVLNREAVKHLGQKTLDKWNYGVAPRFQQGGIVALGKRLQKQGYEVGENPAFGGVAPVHVKGSLHYTGHALDVNADNAPGGEAARLDGLAKQLIAQGWHVLWRVAGHFDHLHVDDATGSGSTGAAVKAPKIKAVLSALAGGAGALTNRALSVDRDRAQAIADRVAASIGTEGPEHGRVGASGDGAALMQQIAKQRGWNFADWWSLDGRETGHGSNLVNPTSTARLRGQFLKSNWGAYGPGSNPTANPSMAQQIESMAAYIADRYANPTAAWAHEQAAGWYQRGGLVQLLKAGGMPQVTKTGAQPTVIGRRRKSLKRAIAGAHAVEVPGLLQRIKAIGLPKALEGRLAKYGKNAGIFGEYADRASSLSIDPDTTGYDDLPLEQLQDLARQRGLDPTGMNKATLLARLADPIPGVVAGHTETEWLTQQLDSLFKWRNALIRAEQIAVTKREQTTALITTARSRLGDVVNQVAGAAHTSAALKKQLAAAQKHPKKNKALITALQAKIKVADGLVNSRTALRDKLAKTVIPALTTKRSALVTARGDLLSSLQDVQGAAAPMDRLAQLPAIGVLGGQIFDTQLRLQQLTAAKPSIADDPDTGDSGASDDTDSSELSDLLRQAVVSANQRTAVSERQFDVLRGMPPYGGSFKDGGVVPGPVGQARTIVAHGGEIVEPVGANGGSHVRVVVEDHRIRVLVDDVEQVVERVTRRQARKGARGLPGRGGGRP